jgi:fibronectin-binding autotransporter adhesin
VLSSGGSVTIQNTGTVKFTGSNTYTGDTILNGGTLSVGVITNLGSVTNGLIFGGGTLLTTNGMTTTRVTTLNGGGGTIDTNGFNSEFSGVFSGIGALTKSGTGTLTLSGTNTYLGNTHINAGTLSVGTNSNLGNAANGLTFDGGTLLTTGAITSSRATILNASGGTIDTNEFNSTFSGVISSVGSGALTKIGLGTLTLSDTNIYTGDTNINGGTISVGSNSNLGDAANGLTFDGGTLLTTGSITSSRATTLNIGGGTIDTNGFNSTFSGVISGAGALTKIGAGILTLSGTNTYAGNTNINGGTISIGASSNLGGASNGLTFAGGTLFTTAGITSTRGVTLNASGGTIDTNGFDSTFSGTIIGTSTLTKVGTGTLTLSGTNAYLGNTNINGGTISIGASSNLGSGVNGLTFNGGTLFTTAGITSARAVTLNLSGGTIDTNGFDSTFSGAISGSGALTKLGTGTLTLSATNTYMGDTIINGGVISIGTNSHLGDAGNGLTLNGGTLFTTGSITTSRATTLNIGGGSINTNGFDSTFSGVFSGAGSLTKLGIGTLTLSGTNTYFGDTIVNVGIISIGAGSNLGDASNSLIFSGGTLQTSAGLATSRAVTLNAGGRNDRYQRVQFQLLRCVFRDGRADENRRRITDAFRNEYILRRHQHQWRNAECGSQQ